jgi:osmoprotectant transport system permease protein
VSETAYGPDVDRGATESDEGREPTGSDAEGAPPPTATRRARAMETAGLWLAPLLITLLAGLLYLYVRSLDLDNAPTQQRSALSWGGKLQPQLLEHLQIAFWSTAIVVVVAIPLGILLTRPSLRRIGPYVLTVANSGQALPAYGLLVIFLIIMGQGKITAIWALALYALLPVLRNTMVGLDGVDRNVIEAGRGMGMTRLRVLSRIEMPLAVPVVIAGVRTAMILNIGMATLAFLIGGGGLGITINSGIKLNQDPVLIVGAWLVALVALSFDWVGAVAERYLRPRGL